MGSLDPASESSSGGVACRWRFSSIPAGDADDGVPETDNDSEAGSEDPTYDPTYDLAYDLAYDPTCDPAYSSGAPVSSARHASMT